MAEEKKAEAFLQRWSRLKREQPPAKAPGAPEAPAPVLPPVDQLTPASDFTGFMHPGVQDALRRVALKKLFSDAHFNLPDPFEHYSADLTGGEPIPEAMLASLEQVKQMLKKPPEQAQAAETSREDEPQSDEPGRKDA